ncbi:dimethylargininase [candidate division KSB1 bacterium]|nr:dimethylargininase [candidate division KSB1 bacterium]
MQRLAITRMVSRSIEHCELLHLQRQSIDVKKAIEQHKHYEDILGEAGFCLLRLPELPQLPDSCFVEDTALVFNEIAIITRPGALSRRPEIESIKEVLSPYRRLFLIQAPATLDGGDVLSVGKQVYVGLSNRTNRHAVSQLQKMLNPFGYTVLSIPFGGCLHLKTAVTLISGNILLINPDWVNPAAFHFDHVTVDKSEPFAANALLLNEFVLYPSAYPKTLKKLRDAGIKVRTVDLSELAKAEGAVTCCSLIFQFIGEKERNR